MGWVLVAMLAVAGFAAFSAEDEAPTAEGASSTLTADVGRTAGAVSALAFIGATEATPTTVAQLESLDPTVAGGRAALGLPAEPERTTPTDKQGGVYVRSGYLSETEVRRLVSDSFLPADVNRAIRVAWCVSAFNPAAVNPATGASGLFQHLPEHWAERSEAAGRNGASIFSPEANIAVAAWMLYELPGGWSHWDCAP